MRPARPQPPRPGGGFGGFVKSAFGILAGLGKVDARARRRAKKRGSKATSSGQDPSSSGGGDVWSTIGNVGRWALRRGRSRETEPPPAAVAPAGSVGSHQAVREEAERGAAAVDGTIPWYWFWGGQ